MIDIRIERADFDVGVEVDGLAGAGVGGIATFVGLVRGDGGLSALRLDHYPAMTELALQDIAAQAQTRWGLAAVTIIHRVGALGPGDRIVFVGVASAHRAAALDACAFLIDRLKTDVPFWKHESFDDGRAGWVEERQTDHVAAARWGQPSAL